MAVAIGLSLTGATVGSAAAPSPGPLARAVRGPHAAGCSPITIRSKANGRYVSAELGYTGDSYGELRARATVVGPWERFAVCPNGRDWAIYSVANRHWVSAELGYPGAKYGMLRARAATIGPWERFSFNFCGPDCVAIRSTANGRYVSAELGYTGPSYGMLRARATTVAAWERFD